MGTILIIAGFVTVLLIVWPELIWTIALGLAPRMPEKRSKERDEANPKRE